MHMAMPLILAKLDLESSVPPLFYSVLLIFLDCFDFVIKVERALQLVNHLIAYS